MHYNLYIRRSAQSHYLIIMSTTTSLNCTSPLGEDIQGFEIRTNVIPRKTAKKWSLGERRGYRALTTDTNLRDEGDWGPEDRAGMIWTHKDCHNEHHLGEGDPDDEAPKNKASKVSPRRSRRIWLRKYGYRTYAN